MAQPAVTSVEGAASHAGSLTIHGSAFGTKAQAPPLIWDDAESKTLDDPTAVTGQGGWDETWARPTMPVREEWKVQYRADGFRTINSPHARSTAYIAGGHWSDAEDLGRNVAITRDNGAASNQWYASWYVRLDPAWPVEDGGACTLVPNYKDYVYQEAGMSYTGAFKYSACTSCIVRGDAYIGIGHGHLCGTIAPDPALRPSERYGWRRREIVLQNAPGFLLTYAYDGTERVQAYDVHCAQGGPLESWDIRSFTVGGFMKNSDSSGNPPYDYPNYAPLRDISDHWYTWVKRPGVDEYYVTFDGSSVNDSSIDPWIKASPEIVRMGGVDYTTEGTVGSLGYGEWAYGDADGLGFNTIYVRLPQSVTERDPGNNGPCYIVLTATSGKGNGRTHPDAFRYFDDVYIDNTLARVVLANHIDIDQATIVEPQIPTAWQNLLITVTVNLGMLPPSGSTYLFVFDSANNHNSTGLCVAGPCLATADGGPGDLTVADAAPDRAAPDAGAPDFPPPDTTSAPDTAAADANSAPDIIADAPGPINETSPQDSLSWTDLPTADIGGAGQDTSGGDVSAGSPTNQPNLDGGCGCKVAVEDQRILGRMNLVLILMMIGWWKRRRR